MEFFKLVLFIFIFTGISWEMIYVFDSLSINRWCSFIYVTYYVNDIEQYQLRGSYCRIVATLQKKKYKFLKLRRIKATNAGMRERGFAFN